jgi:hypothetical protein
VPARAFPDPLPDWVRANPLRRAEVKVYDALRSQLSSQYALFYSRPWIGTNADGTEKEGEADFVVASEKTGFLVLEVKGGGVGRDAKTDEWFSIDREKRRHTIKDPIKQALRSKNELLERLRTLPELTGRWIGIGSAVILPDCTGTESLLGIDTPRDHFALSEDLPDLGKWVRDRLEHTVGTHGGALGRDGVAGLEKLIAHSFQLRVPLATTIASDYERVITVTEQQYALLEFLEEHSRAAIGGAAGSGKTILALHKAISLATSHPAWRILITCFNAGLAAWLRRSTTRFPNVYAASFHETCGTVAKLAGLSLPQADSSANYFDETLPSALLRAVSEKPALLFDAIVVDEGQDFADRWLETLELALRDEDSPYWVFYDDNQQLYRRPTSLLRDMPQAPFVLRKNVRNPRPVFDLLMPMLGGIAVVPLGPEGRPVEKIVIYDRSTLAARIARLIAKFVEDEQIDPEDIAVLVPAKEQLEELCPKGKFDRVATCRADEEPRGRVCLDTVRRFKGLERKVVILVDPADMQRTGDLLYVGVSRPTGHLVMIGTRMPQTQRSDRD